MHESADLIRAASGAATRAAAAVSQALDLGDFAAAGRLLAAECECTDGALRARGAEAVLAVYRVAAGWAEQAFDDVRHDSVVERDSNGDAHAIVTTYLLRVPGRWHRLRHARWFSVNPSGQVTRIVNTCEASAAAAFRAFVRDCGAAPPPPGFGA